MCGDQDVDLGRDKTDCGSPSPFPGYLPLSPNNTDSQSRSRYPVGPRRDGIYDKKDDGVDAVFAKGFPNNECRDDGVEQDRARP